MAIEMTRGNISEITGSLVCAIKQLATANDMGAKLQFLSDQKKEGNLSFTQTTFEEVSALLWNTGSAGRILRIGLYDKENDLIAFYNADGERVKVGYASDMTRSEYRIATVNAGERPQNGLYQNNSKPPQNVHHGNPFGLYKEISTTFMTIDKRLCAVTSVPVNGMVYSDEKEDMVSAFMGSIFAVRTLDNDIVARTAGLTGTCVNLFSEEGLSAGNLTGYDRIDLSQFPRREGDGRIETQELRFTDREVAGDTYFEANLPLYSKEGISGAVSVLYSKRHAIKNAWEIIRTLCVISSIFFFLAIPVTFRFSEHFISKPIIHLKTCMEGLAKGDLTIVSSVSSRDELGQLSDSSNLFIHHFRSLIKKLTDDVERLTKFSSTLTAISDDMAAKSAQMNSQSNVAVGLTGTTASRIRTMSDSAASVSQKVSTLSSVSGALSESMNHAFRERA